MSINSTPNSNSCLNIILITKIFTLLMNFLDCGAWERKGWLKDPEMHRLNILENLTTKILLINNLGLVTY
jgi:hypothetical protein